MSKFIDVDFTTDPRYVPGYSPKFRSHKKRFGAAVFGDRFEVLSAKDRREAADQTQKDGGLLSLLIKRILNQLSEGSCVGQMGAQALMVLMSKAVGKDLSIDMSAQSLYRQIGSSPNSGANVEDAIDRLNDTGILPRDTPENRARFKHVGPDTGFYTKPPSDWKETASMFAGLEGVWCDNPEEMSTALALGMPVGVGRDGHSVLYLDNRYEGSDEFKLYVNSWGPWGIGAGGFPSGFGLDSSRYFREAADWCFAFQAPDVSKWTWLNVTQS